MEQPTLTPSAAAASAAPLFLPTMPTSWFASLDKKPNLSDRFMNSSDSHHHRLSGDGGEPSVTASVHDKSSYSKPMTATSSSMHGSNVATNMTTNYSLVEVRQPIPLKPATAALQPIIGLSTSSSTMANDESMRDQQLPLPSLHASLYKSDESSSDVLQHYARMPMMNAPQLRMRPVSIAKETQNAIITMPSPIARRGEAERAFLQRQMKAEALIRREQARHNQERKLRNACTILPPPCLEGEQQQEEDELAGNERLAISQLELHPATADGKQPINRKHSRQQFLREFASSPPLILKKSFKRSVSAVLADSGIAENENLLFFPDGLPLLNEQEEVVAALNDVAGDADSATESPGGSGTGTGGGDDGSVDVDASEKGTPRESATSTNEPSPSLIAADLIWQIGASSCDDDDLANELPMPHQLSKKVTLRPKMNNAPCLTNSSGPISAREFKPIGAGISSDGTSCLSQGKKSIGCSSDDSNEDKLPYDFASRDNSIRDILSASESFQNLSFENDDKAWGALNRSDSMGRAGSSVADGNKVPPPLFTFSSPEPGRNRQIFSSVAVDPSSSQYHPNGLDFLLKEPMSDSNYCTPDNSESKRFNRKIPTERLPKLPELGMPDVLHNSIEETRLRCNTAMSVEEGVEEDDQFEIGLNEHMSEINFYTPEVTKP
ncbi:hypothetical protein ACHAWU_002219 [Discostella pseudostelligera]|uniref:Uncharacterized protein n=1 Tax=Discostella pseudostelligera TaxID=259834 RepID=A0ABD3MB57_9STRA